MKIRLGTVVYVLVGTVLFHCAELAVAVWKMTLPLRVQRSQPWNVR